MFSNQPANVQASTTTRKRYRKPNLETLGDLRGLTLGGSLGTGESTNPTTRKTGSAPIPGPDDFLTPPWEVPPPGG